MTDELMKRESGLSLVGVLVVLVILGGLAALAVAALPGDGAGTSGPLQGLIPGELPDGGSASGVPAGLPASPAAGARVAACLANVRSVQQAAGGKHAADGSFPATVAELVAGHWLADAPVQRGYDLMMEAVGGRPSGKVLVNGLPADQGCAAAPRPGP